ncbi:hypothetical protein PFICI_11834 [Pestalotiopsis fici W106-1]|uniref:F-box domain-containing protein n=1 Tax=Pestalotiopsis fici (strain W106-1 / CGMCC3.15140) TaxID=1229662 RepID=W3WTG3_PESFW|nr:uncharacterized protein PFICI_11834 [Pestalotiopsis fici W106-1]ETS76447.1 hypothetical protein PFICI_11834 [Pestalotiopsis fici W106-1]
MALESLPTELILLVFQQIADTEALQATARTCKKFQQVVEICLYSHVLCTRRASANRLLELCRADPRRATYVHDLQLVYSTRHHDFQNTAPVDLCFFPCLNSFVSESPFCNSHARIGAKSESVWQADMQAYLRAFEQASLLSSIPSCAKPLGFLKSVILHWTGSISSRFWRTTPLCPIFLLPELQSLTVSCVKIRVEDEDRDISQFAKSTKLESLSFVESVVSPRALEQILSYPTALKRLTLHEVTHHATDTLSYDFLRDDVETSHEALELQAESLEEFDFSGHHDPRGMMSSRPLTAFNLANFRSLSYLKLNWSVRLDQPPPNLRTLVLQDLSPLTFRGGAENVLARLPKLTECLKSASRRQEGFQVDLRLYRIPLHFFGHHRRYDVADGDHQPLRRVFEELRHKMIDRYTLEEHPGEDLADIPEDTSPVSAGPPATERETWENVPVRLRILTSKHRNFIPPYLHGEKSHRWVVRYDSDYLDIPPYFENSGNPEGDDSSEDEDMQEAFRLDSAMF